MVRDRRSLPLQVRDEVLQLIDRDGLKAGQQLPTEANLAQQFGVGRTTAREALKLLEQDGLIEVRHGLGRFVSALPSLQRPITRLESVTEMMRNLGHTVTNQVLEVRERSPLESEIAALGLQPGETVVHLERIRSQGDDPLIYSIDIVPRQLIERAPESVGWDGSLLALLETAGYHVASAIAEMRAVRLPRRIAAAVGPASEEPWLLMIHTNLSETGRPLIYSHDYYRGDKFTFNVLRRRTD